MVIASPSSLAQVHTAEKRSIPDIRTPAVSLQSAPDVVHFDSLHSMPLSFPWLPDLAPTTAGAAMKESQLDMTAVHAAADWLRDRLQLRLFGFDIVVDSSSGTALGAARPAFLHCRAYLLTLYNSQCPTEPLSAPAAIVHLNASGFWQAITWWSTSTTFRATRE